MNLVVLRRLESLSRISLNHRYALSPVTVQLVGVGHAIV